MLNRQQCKRELATRPSALDFPSTRNEGKGKRADAQPGAHGDSLSKRQAKRWG